MQCLAIKKLDRKLNRAEIEAELQRIEKIQAKDPEPLVSILRQQYITQCRPVNH